MADCIASPLQLTQRTPREKNQLPLLSTPEAQEMYQYTYKEMYPYTHKELSEPSEGKENPDILSEANLVKQTLVQHRQNT